MKPKSGRHRVGAQRVRSVDILVNNAGEAPSAPFVKTDLATWNKAFAVNRDRHFPGDPAVVPDMARATAGRVINIASTAGLVGYAYVSAYVAAKHAVIGLTRALRSNSPAPGSPSTRSVRATPKPRCWTAPSTTSPPRPSAAAMMPGRRSRTPIRKAAW